MKVLIYTLYLPNPTDGASTSARSLKRALKNQGIIPIVCTTCNKNSIEQDIYKDEDGVLCFPNTFNHQIEPSYQFLKYLYLNLHQYDLVHFRGIFSLGTTLGALICKLKKTPYIISPTGNWLPRWKERKLVSNGLLKWIYFQLLGKQALKNSNAVICSSKLEQNLYSDLLRNQAVKIFNIPNGLSEDFMTLSGYDSIEQAETGNYVLFLGRISREKNLEFLINVFSKVVNKNKEAKLVLAGEAQDVAYINLLISLARNLGIEKSVSFNGKVAGKDKFKLLKNARVLALPSIKESFGNVVLEALYSGTPAVTSTGCPWGILNDLSLGKCIGLNETLWEQTLNEYLAWDLKKKNEFRVESASWVINNFSWEKIGSSYLEIYKKVLFEFDKSISK